MFVAHEQVREGVEGVHSKGFGDTVHETPGHSLNRLDPNPEN